MNLSLTLALTSLAAFGLMSGVLRWKGGVLDGRLVRVVTWFVVGLLLISAAIQRFAGTDRLLWGSDEMGNLFSGIRLHLLPWWNLSDHVERNFFKSLVMPVHGLVDTVFFYLVVWGFRLLQVPVTEAHLFQAGAVLSMVTLVWLYFFVRRLCGQGTALVVLAMASWSALLIYSAKAGYQLNVAAFLQVAILYGYVQHVVKKQWWWSALMSLLMVLCAGSELFYLAPVLLLLHQACSQAIAQGDGRLAPAGASAMGWWDRKNVVVWSTYGATILANVLLLLRVGWTTDLTLFGRLIHKRAVEVALHPTYGPGMFLNGLDSVIPAIPHFAVVAFVAGVWLLLWRSQTRPFDRFFIAYFFLIAALTYAMRLSHAFNFLHLLVPAFVVVALAAMRAVPRLLSHWIRRPDLAQGFTSLACVAALLPLATPWRPMPGPAGPPPAYQSMKAVGYALRTLGHPRMQVLILSHHHAIPVVMEYYVGLGASVGDGASTRLLYLHQLTNDYLPSRLAARLGVAHFDYYVEFVKAEFPERDRVLEDLRGLGLRLVGEVTSHGEVEARIWSPHEVGPLQVTVEEGNRGFDRIYAQWDQLFYEPHAGAFYYFGASY
ncbi:MAG: hypothetical protein HYT88_06230 [Candidatus Omnitrophica bacterium]|nr:hypothetical protein [Candidatus Omnitrophota bacterium]MBI3010603.1 hypothetical protein [Candidatus Omnitrophota bacterium]